MTRSAALFIESVRLLPIGFAIIFITATPNLLFFLGLAPSLGLGAAIVAVLLITSSTLFFSRVPAEFAPTLLLVGFIILGLATHLAIVSLFIPVDIMRALSSLVVVVILFLGADAVRSAMDLTPDAEIHKATMGAFAFLCVVGLLPIIGLTVPHLGPNPSPKPVFPFTEPSHFALAVSPFLIYASVQYTGWIRTTVILTFGAMVIGLQNLTLGISWLMIVFVFSRGTLQRIGIIVTVIVVVTVADLSYFTERAILSTDSDNLSVLVYLQGWALMVESLLKSYWLGIGFQQLGVFGTENDISFIIFSLIQNESNLLDGGFLAAKLISELGIFGIVIVVFLLGLSIRSAHTLRRVASEALVLPPSHVLAHSIRMSLVLELLARSTSYLSGTILLFLAANMFITTSGRTRYYPAS